MCFERAERARYRSTTRVRVCASVSNRQLGSGLEVPFKTSFAQLAELHTVSHSASTPARGNMPAATRVQFCVLVEVTWYPTDPPVYPRCCGTRHPTDILRTRNRHPADILRTDIDPTDIGPTDILRTRNRTLPDMKEPPHSAPAVCVCLQ